MLIRQHREEIIEKQKQKKVSIVGTLISKRITLDVEPSMKGTYNRKI